MGAAVSRESYLETGLDTLSDLGYGGLKLAEVCNRLGVTTGSFYHYFTSWAVYCQELITHWTAARTVHTTSRIDDITDPRSRIGVVVRESAALPHSTEAAIRVWSAIDPAVGRAQAEVDQRRYDVLHEAAKEILRDDQMAQRFATAAMYLLIGCEQSTFPRVQANMEWISEQLLYALDIGVFGDASGAGPGERAEPLSARDSADSASSRGADGAHPAGPRRNDPR
jgi:AcrR family transcriptional regulator